MCYRLKAAAVAARALGVQLQVVEARSPAEFDSAFSDMTRARAGGLAVQSSPLFVSERSRLVDLAAKNRLPTVFPYSNFVDAGGLMAYGPNLVDLSRRAATYVDGSLKGAKPGRPARRAADQIRAGDQPQDREGARPDDPAVGAGARGPSRREMRNPGDGSNPKRASRNNLYTFRATVTAPARSSMVNGAMSSDPNEYRVVDVIS